MNPDFLHPEEPRTSVGKRRERKEPPATLIKQRLVSLIKTKCDDPHIPDDIPKKWQLHGDLVLLPSDSFQDKIWLSLGEEVWDVICDILKCKRIARRYRVKNDQIRTPNTELLRGDDGWIFRTDNGIKMTFDVTKCMFSAGNITEKLRISKFDCQGEVVVDLYAGIGYFTLPYLVHAKATLVHACELNPDAIEALTRNLKLNNVEDRCIIHPGNNIEACPKGIADRVNLGLIPSAAEGYFTACAALKPESGGMLHVHGVVSSAFKSKGHRDEWVTWTNDLCVEMKNILKNIYCQEWVVTSIHLEHLKSYAPHLDHLVADLQCRPLA